MRQRVRYASGDSPTRAVKRRASVARETLTAAASESTVHGVPGWAWMRASAPATTGSRSATSQHPSSWRFCGGLQKACGPRTEEEVVRDVVQWRAGARGQGDLQFGAGVGFVAKQAGVGRPGDACGGDDFLPRAPRPWVGAERVEGVNCTQEPITCLPAAISRGQPRPV